jgi:hypothetical protein
MIGRRMFIIQQNKQQVKLASTICILAITMLTTYNDSRLERVYLATYYHHTKIIAKSNSRKKKEDTNRKENALEAAFTQFTPHTKAP